MSLGAPALHTQQKKEQSGAPFVSTAAANGLSVDPSTGQIVLGNDSGAAGDPAQLLSTRDILINGFAVEMHQGPFASGGFAGLGIMLDGSIGGLAHAVRAECINQPNGTILYRGTHDDANCIGAMMQLECPNDALNAVGQFGAFGSNASNPAFLHGMCGIQSGNVVQPDVVLKAASKGAPGARPGRIVFGTNSGGVDLQTYSFLMPATAALDFPNTLAQTSSDLTIPVPGAVDGDSVILAVPVASQVANTCYTAFVSAADTVTVRFNNYSAAAVNPAAGNFKVSVIKLL